MNEKITEPELYFFYYIQVNNLEKFQELLCSGSVNVNKVYKTVKKNNKYVLNNDLYINRRSIVKYLTPLMLSIINKNTIFMQLLIDNGADINMSTSSNDDTALTIAIMEKHEESIKILLEKGANPNKFHIVYTDYDDPDDDYEKYYEWMNPLLYLILSNNNYTDNNMEIIKLLFEYGANINSTYEDYMLDNNPDEQMIPGYDNYTDKNILTILVKKFNYANNTYLPNIIQLLIEKGLNINLDDGNSALLYAIKYDNINIIKIFLHNGYNIDFENQEIEIVLKECNDEIKEFVTEYMNNSYVLK